MTELTMVLSDISEVYFGREGRKGTMAKITVEQVVRVAVSIGNTNAPFENLVARLCEEYGASKAAAVKAINATFAARAMHQEWSEDASLCRWVAADGSRD
jgi:hypothetical protein